MPGPTSEKPLGVIAWAILLVGILVFVVVADIWLHHKGFEYMTTEFKEGLDNPIYGPILTALWFGTFIGLTFHFYLSRNK